MLSAFGVSEVGDSSESCRSGGGGVVSRFSSEVVDGWERCGNREEGVAEEGSEMIVEALDDCAADT